MKLVRYLLLLTLSTLSVAYPSSNTLDAHVETANRTDVASHAEKAKSPFGRCHIAFAPTHQSKPDKSNGAIGTIRVTNLTNGAGVQMASWEGMRGAGPRWKSGGTFGLALSEPKELRPKDTVWLLDSIAYGYQMVFTWKYDTPSSFVPFLQPAWRWSEWVDIAFGRNHGDGVPSTMRWTDLEGNFKIENTRAACYRNAWYKWDENKIMGYVRRRETSCEFDCLKNMEEW